MSDHVRKRWVNHYVDGDPFDLPNSVSRGVRDAASACHRDESNPVRYLWVHYSSKNTDGTTTEHRLTRDEWLGVVDEASSMGVRLAIVSLTEPFADAPDMLSVAEWAQSTYDLMIGFHVYGRTLTRTDARQLSKMNPELTRVFVESDQLEAARFIEELGIRVLPADGINEGDTMPSCDLPKSMTCVCAEGGLYTCGLVAGDEHYHMGNFLGRKLRTVMNDESVPHAVPAGVSDAPGKCSGCPPLMAQRILEDTR